MKKGTKKIFETEYNSPHYQNIKWSIWNNTTNDNKYLRLYVDVYGYDGFNNKYGYFFGYNCNEPRSVFFPISDDLADLITDVENPYDLYHSDLIREKINNAYNEYSQY